MVTLKRTFLPSLVGLALALGLMLVTAHALSPVEPAGPSGPEQGAYDLHHAYFMRDAYGQSAIVYLQNMAGAQANATLSFHPQYGPGGPEDLDRTIPAHGTLELGPEQLPELAEGTIYGLTVMADQPLASVVEVHRDRDEGDKLAAYRGVSGDGAAATQGRATDIPTPAVAATQYFGPYYKNVAHPSGDTLNASVGIWNQGDETAVVAIQFIDMDGSVAGTATKDIEGKGYHSFYSANQALPDGFEGWAIVQSDRPVTALLVRQAEPGGAVFEIHDPLGQGAIGFQVVLPRALKGVDAGGGPRTTTLFVGNKSSQEGDATLEFYDEHGTILYVYDFAGLPGTGAATLDLGDEGFLPDDRAYGVVLESTEPMVMGEMTEFEAPSPVSAAAYGTSVGTQLSLPRLALTSSAYTVFSLQNAGDTEAHLTIDYRDLVGSLILSQTVTLPAGALARYDQRDMPELGDDFDGSAVVTSDQTLRAWVDDYYDDRQTCWARINDGVTEYSTVQAAVDAAASGDTVKVAGTCSGAEERAGLTQTIYIDKSITLRGGYTTTNWTVPDPEANPTTLDAQGQGRVVYVTGDISPTIQGLRITGGDATGLGGDPNGWDAGGGVYVITGTATLQDNDVFSNTARLGGGLYLYQSAATVAHNLVFSNTTSGPGGGLYVDHSDATVDGNAISDNTAGTAGGGLHLWFSDATVNGNRVTNNDAGTGGAIYIRDAGLLTGNTISDNSANNGAGLYLYFSDATLDGNAVLSNTASVNGGGLLLDRSDDARLDGNTILANTAGDSGGGLALLYSDATLTNNVVADNRADVTGSGLYIWSASPRLMHTTLARNADGSGDGVYVCNAPSDYSTVALTNTILVSHTLGVSVTAGNTVTLDSTLWWANAADWDAAGHIAPSNDHTGNPAFVDPGAGDYHIGPGSAAHDVGVDAGVTTDIDAEPRPQGAGYDIGADEDAHHHNIYLPVVLRG